MTERQFKKLETEIVRYRLLEREVTDPLAACLIHTIILDLEADLQQRRDQSQRLDSATKKDEGAGRVRYSLKKVPWRQL